MPKKKTVRKTKKKSKSTRPRKVARSRKKAPKRKPVRKKKPGARVTIVEVFEVDVVGSLENPLELEASGLGT